MRFAQKPKAALSSKLRRIIYVEGQDDAFFLDKLLGELAANEADVGIVHLNGDGALEGEIGFLAKSASYVQRLTTHLAFFLDADTGVKQRMASVNAGFNRIGWPITQHGAFADYDNGRRVGVFIFPNGVDAGELEDLLLTTVASDDRLATVSEALSAVERDHGNLNKRSKRIARMYISVLPVKPCGVGRGYCEGVFPADHPSIEAVRDFLREFLA